MANNTDLIKEIDSWLLTFTPGYLKYIVSNTDAKALRETLQRARDALRWKPINENMPYDTVLLFMRPDGNVRQDFVYDEGLERVKKDYVGWMHVPEYRTPED